MMTNGIERERSRFLCAGGRLENSRMTPSGRRRSTPPIHSGPGECRVPLSVRTRLAPLAFATLSTPRISSIVQRLSISCRTISMSGASVAARDPRR
ncbi:hypothetical protein [Actinomadura madurae]|uniref:hypothetical protein n=1 Tax=Actinomadura madurae TaxID=1993 RepID=UPI0027E228AE|nr:hypothetical protein [Actinomadura madurae]